MYLQCECEAVQGAAWAGLGRTIKMMNLGETPPRPHQLSTAQLASAHARTEDEQRAAR